MLRKVKIIVKRNLQTFPAFKSIPYWFGAFSVGLFAVGYARTFEGAIEITKHIYHYNPLIFLGLSPVCFLLGWWVNYRFAPAAAGSGIPQVMAAIDTCSNTRKPVLEYLIGFKTCITKILSSLFVVLGGAAIGREGPTIHIAASLFYGMGVKFRKIWPSLNMQSMIIAGGAAGIASAFNTPLGGIVYAIEELATEGFNKFRSFLILAVIISGLVAQGLFGSYLYLGYPKIEPFDIQTFPFIIFVGVLTGLAGGVFGRILFVMTLYKKRVFNKKQMAVAAATMGLGMASLIIVFGPLSIGSGSDLITQILFNKETDVHWSMIIPRFIGSLISYLGGAAGGIFAPSLASGAAIGSEIAYFVGPEHTNLLILVGMIGFLTGVTRTPFTAFVLVLEMTDRHSAIFPMMVSALTAYGASRLIDAKSFYEHMKINYLESHKSLEKALKERNKKKSD